MSTFVRTTELLLLAVIAVLCYIVHNDRHSSRREVEEHRFTQEKLRRLQEEVHSIQEKRSATSSPDHYNRAGDGAQAMVARSGRRLARVADTRELSDIPPVNLSLSLLYRDHQVYEGLKLRPFDAQSWNKYEYLYQRIIKEMRPSVCAEVGVWKGGTTAVFGKALLAQGFGKMLAVDTWLGELGFWGDGLAKGGVKYTTKRADTVDKLTTVRSKRYASTANKRGLIPSLEWVNGYPSVYYTFLSNMVHQGVQDVVIPVPIPSQMAARFFSYHRLSIDVLHIDGAHEYDDAKADIEAWWALLRPGGVMIGDDYMPYAPGVARAANELAERERAIIFQDGVKFVILKPGGGAVPPYFQAQGVECPVKFGGALCHPDWVKVKWHSKSKREG